MSEEAPAADVERLGRIIDLWSTPDPSRADHPHLSSPYGVGAEAAHALYQRIGQPLATVMITDSERDEFWRGWDAASRWLMDNHPQNVLNLRTRNTELQNALRIARRERDQAKDEVVALKDGTKPSRRGQRGHD